MDRRSWVFDVENGAEYSTEDGLRWRCAHCDKTYKAAAGSGTKSISEHLERHHGITKPTAPGLQRPRRRVRKTPVTEDTPSPPPPLMVTASAQRPMATSASTTPVQTTRATNMGVIQNINLKQEQYYARVGPVVARFIEPLLERLDALEQNERGLKKELEIERENSRTVQEALEKNARDVKNVVDAQKRNSSALNAVAQDKVRDEVEAKRRISRAVIEALNGVTNEAREQKKWPYCCHLEYNHEVLDEVVENPDVEQGALKQEAMQQDVGEDESNIPWHTREWNLRVAEAVGVACADL